MSLTAIPMTFLKAKSQPSIFTPETSFPDQQQASNHTPSHQRTFDRRNQVIARSPKTSSCVRDLRKRNSRQKHVRIENPMRRHGELVVRWVTIILDEGSLRDEDQCGSWRCTGGKECAGKKNDDDEMDCNDKNFCNSHNKPPRIQSLFSDISTCPSPPLHIYRVPRVRFP